jgi:hypothetical protein
MTTINNTQSISDWPYPLATDIYNQGRDEWVEVNEKTYWHMLECLPPEWWVGQAFLVGEPADHTNEGKSVHSMYYHEKGRYFCKDVVFDTGIMKKELQALIDTIREQAKQTT